MKKINKIAVFALIFIICFSVMGCKKSAPSVSGADNLIFNKKSPSDITVGCDLKGKEGKIHLDNTALIETYYTFSNDKKSVIIHKEYLETLPVAKYDFKLVTSDGSAVFKIDVTESGMEDILTKPSDAMNVDHSKKLMYVKDKGLITGKTAAVNTNQWQLANTDIGLSFYDPELKRIHMAFGDSYSTDFDTGNHFSGEWNQNILLYTTDLDFSDGIKWTGAFSGQTGNPSKQRQITPLVTDSSKVTPGTHTNIPTGAVVVDGIYYMFYMEVKQFNENGVNGAWQVFSNRVMKSTDKGITWTQHETLKWTQQDAPNFGQIAPLIVGEYVYLFGIQGGRADVYGFGDGMKVARVLKSSFENINEYEYFAGFNGDTPRFIKGANGLKFIKPGNDGHEDSFVVTSGMSEPSVMYNEYLGKFVLSYYTGGRIVFRTSANPWGNWSAAETIVNDAAFAGKGGLYGAFNHEVFTTHNGQRMYVFVSHWTPTYNVRMLEVVFN